MTAERKRVIHGEHRRIGTSTFVWDGNREEWRPDANGTNLPETHWPVNPKWNSDDTHKLSELPRDKAELIVKIEKVLKETTPAMHGVADWTIYEMSALASLLAKFSAERRES